MSTKTVKTRVQNKHETKANWDQATNFVPLAGELIIYDSDSTHAYPRFKIGDGTTTVINLPFLHTLGTGGNSNGDLGDITVNYDTGAVEVKNDSHTHDSRYYTESEINTKINTINAAIAAVPDTGATSVTVTGSGNAITTASYDASTRKLTLTKGATYNNYSLPAAGSSLGGVKSGGDVSISSGLITVNDDSHNHVIGNVDGLQDALDELDAEIATKADSGHTHSSYANQNAFSNVKVGDTTVAADTTTDTLTLVGSNVTLTPDATNDKVTIGITKANVTTALGYTPPNGTFIPTSQKGAASGVAELDANGKVPTAQLPSFVDDVLEYSAKSSFPTTGETGKIYVDTATNKTYRWSGSAYTEISASLALGETSSTAYRGDRGKIAYNHSQATHARTDATATAASSANGKIKINGTDTTVYTHPSSHAASMITGLATVATSGSYNDLSNKPTIPTVDSALSYTSTNPAQNKVITTAISKKADDYSLELYNGTAGNPKPVKVMTVNYSTCNSENGVAIKVGMVSGHGNGVSYAFLQDTIIRVNFNGGVEVDNFKYYGANAGTYDGATRQYGDIFWVVNTTNKIVDFYCLMGQYSRINMIPAKRLTYSSGGVVTQHTSAAIYSSGTKEWANNSDIALMSDLDTKAPAYQYNTTDLTANSSALTTGTLYFVYE